MPVTLATQVAEVRGLVEPGRQRLQWAKIMPLHSSLSDRERLHLKTKQKNEDFQMANVFNIITNQENAN